MRSYRWGWLIALASLGTVWAQTPATPDTATPSPTSTATATSSPEATETPAAPSETPVAPASAAPAPTPPAAVPPASRAVWDYQKELALTNAQVARIKKTVRDLQDKFSVANTHIVTARKSLHDLVQGNADLEKIRAKMVEIDTINIDMIIENMRANRLLAKIMTPAQLTKWHDIQSAARATEP